MKREQMDRLFDFLSQLRDHNTRDWFEAHRPLYAEVQRDFMSFVQELIDGISCFDPGVKGLTPKDATYRIYRDVRFSTDKSPYKTHLGTYICPGGKHSEYAGYYIHLEPGASVLATGIYRPRYKIVQSVWEEIFDH
ncbi:MAG: DUF2461 domain-containing protein, partial [Alistipes sp.]|nr:DUF2461 domain-containing protein [Alistipes sp.]